MKRLVPIAAIVLLANGAALLVVAQNARGPADAVLTLTEREMGLTSMGTDTTGMTLTIQWDRRTPIEWFDRAKLVSIGFDCSMAPDAPGASDHYGGALLLPRAAFVAFEYDPSRIVQEPETPAMPARGESSVPGRIAPKTAPEFVSRLRPVDVGSDARALRLRYADRGRYLITAGTVRPRVIRASANEPARLQGQILWIEPIQVYVPQEMQAAVVAAVGKDGNRELPGATLGHAPRYEVTVEYGSSHLPKIVNIKKITR